MALRSYLPSTQFIVIIGSILVSGGLVVAAQQITSSHSGTSSSLTSSSPSPAVATGDWLANLRAIEGQDVGAPPSTTTQTSYQDLLSAAASSNVTNTVARTLFLNLAQAKSEGLGSDIPTQDKLVAEAASQIQKNRAVVYTQADLTLSNNSSAALKTYGNEVIRVISLHPTANFNDTLYAVGMATDKGDPKELKALVDIQKDYIALVGDLKKVPVPPTLIPLHLQVINNLSNMASTYDDMEAVFTDSLRGLSGFQLYTALNDETKRVFINIAQNLKQNGILFNTDEPGASWSLFLSAQ